MSVSTTGSGLHFDSTIDDSQFQASINRMNSSINNFTGNIEDQGNQIERLARQVSVAAASFSFKIDGGFIAKLDKARAEFLQLKVAFSAMLKSKAEVDALMKEISVLAGATPFGLSELAEAAKALLANGSAAGTLVEELRMLGEIAYGVSEPISSLVTIYTSLRAQNLAYAKEIQQFAGLGIPIYAELANVLNIDRESVDQFVNAGKVGFAEVQQAFTNLTASGSIFGDLIQEQSDVSIQQIERFKEAWTSMLAETGKSKIGTSGSDVESTSGLVTSYQKVLDVLKSVKEAQDAFDTVKGIVTLGNSASTLTEEVMIGTELTNVTRALTLEEGLRMAQTEIATGLQGISNGLMAAAVNPYVLAGVAAVALGVAIYALNDSMTDQEKAQKIITEQNQEYAKSAEELKSKVSDLNGLLFDKSATDFQQTKAFAELQKQYPGVFDNLSKEAYLKMGIADAQKLINSENDKNEVADLGKRYEDASEKVNTLSAKIKSLNEIVEVGGDPHGAISSEIIRATEELQVAKVAATELGTSFSKQHEAWKVSLMTDEQKIKHYTNLRNELTRQKDLINKINIGAGGLQSIFSTLSLNNINSQLDFFNDNIKASTNNIALKGSIAGLDEAISNEKTKQSNSANHTQYQKYQKKIDILETRKEKITEDPVKVEQEAAKRKTDMIVKIDDLHRKYNDKSITDDEQKLLDIRQQYASLRKEIDAYNADPKNTKKINKDLKPELEKALENQQYESDTNNLKASLDKQKQIYEEYEQYKNDFGKAAADKKYESDLKTYSTYLEKLEAERSVLLAKDPKDMNGFEKERLTEYNTRINEQVKLQHDAQAKLLLENRTYEQLKLAATDHYNADILKMQGENLEGSRALRTKAYEDELGSLSDSLLSKSDVYKKAADEALHYTKVELVKEIAALEKVLASGVIPADQVGAVQKNLDDLKLTLSIGVDQGNLKALKDEYTRVSNQLKPQKDKDGKEIILSEKESKAITKRLVGIQKKIDEIDHNGDGVANWGDKISEHFSYLTQDFSTAAAGMSKDLGVVSGKFNDLSTAFGGNETQLGYLLGTIGQLAGAASDAAGAAASFYTGDIVGGVTKTISAVTKVLSIGKKVKEMNAAARKEVDDFYKSAVAGEIEYQASLRDRELQTVRNNKTALQGIRDEVELRKKDKEAYSKESEEIMGKLQGQSYVESETYTHGTWFRKAKVNKTYGSLAGKSFNELSQLLTEGKLEGDTKGLVERLKELEEKGYDAEQAMAGLAKETAELFTATTSDNLTNALADMFANGKTSAEDLADFFKTTMDDAALSIFKNKVLADAMEKFYDEFDNAAESGDELTLDEIARLNGLFNSLTGDAIQKFEEYKKITGSDLNSGDTTGSSQTGVSGAIVGAALTEGTANRVLGIAISQYDEIKRQGQSSQAYFYMAATNFQVQLQIEQNTFRTANNTDGIAEKLDVIAANTKPAGGISLEQSLRDKGIKY